MRSVINTIKSRSTRIISLVAAMLLSAPAIMAQTTAGNGPAKSSMDNPMVITLVVIMFALLLVIGILAGVVINLAGFTAEKEKQQTGGTGMKAMALIGFMLLSLPMMAQTNATADAAAAADNYGGVTSTAFYAMIAVIGAEVLVIFFMLFFLRSFLAKEKARAAAAAGVVKQPTRTWWDWFNSFRPMHEESKIDLGHNYDGIRELDNRLPPWWLYGFYITIIFAGIYLWRYHVSHTAPLSGEEFTIAMQKADEEKAAYMKNAANLVDETNVKLLTDAADLAEGKKIFTNPAYCAACHRADGGGQVGPNLTDVYWIYGGGIKDIFKTIKYGTTKGMKSWKDELSPSQIAQVSSYVKSLKGSNPPSAKDPQGDMYEEKVIADSTAKVDSVKK